MRIKLLLLATIAGLLIPVTSAFAHHAFAAEYDDKNFADRYRDESRVDESPRLLLHRREGYGRQGD
jgi:hypothetical protein